ncbi:gas vesicle protein GvpO [Nocardia bhagyanarayanae]|uniref:Gas vesicle protein GvpO n=1 Tax=Nocardia bhagyanarayanae TaxID=1215925 RepID=A0A543FG77_9NOCA|nr:gas vesicle protein GvpO [Nocardia bhagyanarayanae]TQM32865.1 gas vesicle protein GvpO [Nocardia bhagyanarayanae]
MCARRADDETEDGGGRSPCRTAGQAAAVAIAALAELTSKQAEGATSAEPIEEGWLVEVEVLEDRRIPSSADMLALYEVELDSDGNLVAYRRTRRYSRGSTDIGARGTP